MRGADTHTQSSRRIAPMSGVARIGWLIAVSGWMTAMIFVLGIVAAFYWGVFLLGWDLVAQWYR